MTRRSNWALTTVAVSVFLAMVNPANTTTVIPLDFAKIATSAAVIVEGEVIKLETITRGTLFRSVGEASSGAKAPRATRAPARASNPPTIPSADSDMGMATAQPTSSGVRRGQMVFTEVTMAVHDVIAGNAGGAVTFRLAGGTTKDSAVVVFGMPGFELGKRYIVFLRHDYESIGNPIVGFNQGYFAIVPQPGGREAILNANSEIVTAVENHRLRVRRNPKRNLQRSRYVRPDISKQEGSGRVLLDYEASRPQGPETRAMSPMEFKDAIRFEREHGS